MELFNSHSSNYSNSTKYVEFTGRFMINGDTRLWLVFECRMHPWKLTFWTQNEGLEDEIPVQLGFFVGSKAVNFQGCTFQKPTAGCNQETFWKFISRLFSATSSFTLKIECCTFLIGLSQKIGGSFRPRLGYFSSYTDYQSMMFSGRTCWNLIHLRCRLAGWRLLVDFGDLAGGFFHCQIQGFLGEIISDPKHR